jgi:hypothetical protein
MIGESTLPFSYTVPECRMAPSGIAVTALLDSTISTTPSIKTFGSTSTLSGLAM